MKKIFFVVLYTVLCLSAFSQAKKPTLMIVPADVWCNKNNFTTKFDNVGVSETVPNYRAALSNNSDIRLLITKMGAIMAAREFPLKDLEQELKNIQNETVESSLITGKDSGVGITESPIDALKRTAKADIIIDMAFEIKRNGPMKQVTFNVRALDAYTAKQISGVTGVSSPSASAPVETLLEEAVLSYMDNFAAQLQTHFDDMFANGREIKVILKRFDSAPIDFETEFDYNGQSAELADILGVWFEENTVNGRFTEASRTANQVRFDQVRIPIYGKSLSGRETAIDANAYVRDLANMLQKAPYNVPVKRYPRGLGEVWLILGEK